jgi:hypothetical protein
MIATMKKHGRVWEEITSFVPTDEDWKVCTIEGIGEMWMNNLDGYVVLIEGQHILKSYI